MSDLASPTVFLNSPPRIHRCEAGWNWAPPPLPDFDLWYVLDGAGRVVLNGQDYPVAAHTCFVFAPGAQIQAGHDPVRRLRVFAVHFAWPDSGRYRLPAPGTAVRDAGFFAALARRCEASYRQGTALGCRQSAALVGQMLLHLCVEADPLATAPVDERISAVVELIGEDPGRRWTIADLARRAAWSRSQFTRRFAAATGLTPERFLIHARVERAAQLLRETRMSVGEIAAALGYCDVYHFSRQFRQVTGQTATQMRAG